MTVDTDLPILDDHMHLDPRGKQAEAVKEFQRAGGTHAIVVHKPYRGNPPRTEDEHREAMGTTLSLAREARRATDVQVEVALGPHPAEFTQSLDAGLSIEEAMDAYRAGLRVASELIAEGEAIALGEVGRPHYEVPEDVWAASNELFRQALEIAAEHDVAAILHTEPGDPDTFAQWARWADEAGLDRGRVVKHFSPPLVDEADNHGLVPSIIASNENLENALEQGDRFLMETDYMDDPDRPGAVLGPKLVPRRTRQLHEKGTLSEDAWASVHIDVPKRVYGIETDA